MGPGEQEFAFGGHIEETQDVHRRRLARSRWAHHRDEIALFDIEIAAFQCLERGRPGAVALGSAPLADGRPARRRRISPPAPPSDCAPVHLPRNPLPLLHTMLTSPHCPYLYIPPSHTSTQPYP